MPELPEVENVCRGLKKMGLVGATLTGVEFRRKNIRGPLKPRWKTELVGHKICDIERRAKYLIFKITDDGAILNHLGMTGSWREIGRKDMLGPHDHVVLTFDSKRRLVFRDPRRFGIFQVLNAKQMASSPSLNRLGVEPLSSKFSGEFLHSRAQGKIVSIKGFIMDQSQVVGVGNIYASEALFVAEVLPNRRAGGLSLVEAKKLARAIKSVLRQAIRLGGSTIRDYRGSSGEEGGFQSQLKVYGRKEMPCLKCKTQIRSGQIAGRNTFWCPKCQH